MEPIFLHVSSVHRVIVTANQEGRECWFFPLGLIYYPMLGCYCTDLLLRPGVNCPALGSISNRTGRDMGPDTFERWHYIIPCCFHKWSLQTPAYKSLIIQKKEGRIRGQTFPGMSSPQNAPGRSTSSVMTNTPASASSQGPMGVFSVSSHFLN